MSSQRLLGLVLDEEAKRIFQEVLEKTASNLQNMMGSLWLNWAQVGMEYDIRIANIKKLVQIEQEFHKDVISETEQKLKILEEEIKRLKEEAAQLGNSLQVDIPIPSQPDDMLLFEYRNRLEDAIKCYRSQMQQRMTTIERLTLWQKELTDKLGVSIPELKESPLPSQKELDRFEQRLQELQAEREKRIEIYVNTQIAIKELLGYLKEKPTSKFEQMVIYTSASDFQLTDLNMGRLAKLKQDLEERYTTTNNRVLELREKLSKLWECLQEEPRYRDSFLQAHTGCHEVTERAIREEINRCEQIKRQKIGALIEDVRDSINVMWDKCKYSADQRSDFKYFNVNMYSEDLLHLHDEYLQKLHVFYDSNREIFALYETRMNLWAKMGELETRASDPSRFQNRGGQLLEEEKERKTIANKLPKIEAQLTNMVKQYEDVHGVPFTIHGKPLVQLMQDDWEARKQERSAKLSARKQQGNTPATSFRSMAKSPLGKRNRTAAGLPTSAGPSRPPAAKRPLITGSATKSVATPNYNLSAVKRSAMSTVKRRRSGRLAAMGVPEPAAAKRKLAYEETERGRPARPAVCANTLKYKRTSAGKRPSLSGKRRSNSSSQASLSQVNNTKDPLTEDTVMTTYTDFKHQIEGRDLQSRSSLYPNNPPIKIESPKNRTPKPTINLKENFEIPKTPSNLLRTPRRLTRSAVKLNERNWEVPRSPLSANKANLQRPNQGSPFVNRAKTQGYIIRAKNLPPLI